MQAGGGEELRLELLVRHAERLRLRGDHALDALALYYARQDGVAAHLVRAGLDRNALGEADHAPFRGGVGGALRKAVPAGSRGEVDDAAAARRLEQRHAFARAIEHAGEVDGDAAVPVLGCDVLDLAGGPGDARVVDQHVQAAERLLRLGEQPVHVRAAGDVGAGAADVLVERGERLVVDVADEDARARIAERARDREPDARRARGDQHAQVLGRSVHACLPLFSACQTRSGVIGMSRWVTPRAASASSTAFTPAGMEPATPDSPAPFTPSGLVVQGATWWPSLSIGRSSARGIG